MKVKLWSVAKTIKQVDVDFPLYSEWIVSDETTVLNRLDSDGTLFSVSVSLRDAFEFEKSQIDMNLPLEKSFLKTGDNKRFLEAVAQLERLIRECRESGDTTDTNSA